MHNISLEKVSIKDVEALQNIGRKTFYETFSEDNSVENMTKYLSEGFSIEKLSDEIRDNNTEFYFVKNDNDIIAYLKINFGSAQTELKANNALEIERIYVLKAFQGKNIGQLLFEKAVQIARDKNAVFIWLGVWEKNTKAIHFYQKNGFIPFDRHIFKLGDEEQTDIMMKLNLD